MIFLECSSVSLAPLHTPIHLFSTVSWFFWTFNELLQTASATIAGNFFFFLLHLLISLFPNSPGHNSLLVLFFYEKCCDAECMHAYITFCLPRYRCGTHSRNGLAGAEGKCTCHFLFGAYSSPVNLPHPYITHCFSCLALGLRLTVSHRLCVCIGPCF